jgi:predicted permease
MGSGTSSFMQVILAAVLPVLLTVLVGYGIARAGKPFDGKTITFLVGSIGTPVLIFNNLSHTTVAPEALAVIIGATILAMAAHLAIGFASLRASGLPPQIYLASMAFPNSGNLGLPLALYAFGDEGLNYAIAIFAIVSVGNHTVGQTITAGQGRWRSALKSPVVPAAALGIVFGYFAIQLPIWFDNMLDLLSGLTIPLMLLMLGTSLARIPVTTISRSTYLSFLRIGMGTFVGFAIATLFGFEGAERGAFVLQCAMPVAVYNYVYSQIYDTRPEEIASLVVVSTLLSVITVPILLLFLV